MVLPLALTPAREQSMVHDGLRACRLLHLLPKPVEAGLELAEMATTRNVLHLLAVDVLGPCQLVAHVLVLDVQSLYRVYYFAQLHSQSTLGLRDCIQLPYVLLIVFTYPGLDFANELHIVF